MISLEHVFKAYDSATAPAVRDLSLKVEPESLLVLLGESGSGKTTTLKMINRLVEPSSGIVRLSGQNVQELNPIDLRRQIGYAFQGIGLFPHMTVAANIAIVPQLLGWSQREIDARVEELLDLIGLPPTEFANRYPHELSGGQRQRVGVARALAARSKCLLMDEPFGALDPITRDGLQIELKALQKTLHLTIVLVTHNVTEALLLADRIAVMRDGVLLGHDTPARLIAEPPHPYVRELMEMPQRQADRVAALASNR